jgi:hypothetical protein
MSTAGKTNRPPAYMLDVPGGSVLLTGTQAEAAIARDEFEAKLRGLRNLARRAFVDRNAQGTPARDRAGIVQTARKDLRDVVKEALKARAALRDGEELQYKIPLAGAQKLLERAMKKFRHPYMAAAAAKAEQDSNFRRLGADARRLYDDDERRNWRELRSSKFAHHSVKRACELIAKECDLPEKAISSVRAELGKKAARPL